MQNTIQIPIEAKTYFDDKAISLIDGLKPLSVHPRSQPPKGSLAHLPVTHLTSADFIGPIRCTNTDGFGRFLGFEIHNANIHEFLPADAAEKLEKISDKVAKQYGLQNYCDQTYVREHLVGWLRRRRLGEAWHRLHGHLT